jgi:hypothetical protein
MDPRGHVCSSRIQHNTSPQNNILSKSYSRYSAPIVQPPPWNQTNIGHPPSGRSSFGVKILSCSFPPSSKSRWQPISTGSDRPAAEGADTNLDAGSQGILFDDETYCKYFSWNATYSGSRESGLMGGLVGRLSEVSPRPW